jgi:ribosome maturation factor RimP
MIEKSEIEKLVKEYILGTDLFIVGIKTGNPNRITVQIDTMDGITIDECAALHRYLEKNLDRNVEDYELQVSSPGLDTPFSVMEQYYKNEGQNVAVIDVDGIKYSGTLKNITLGGFDLETEIKSRGKGKETKDIPFNFDQVKSTKVILTIK